MATISATKKRKLDPSSNSAPLSAFAARKALRAKSRTESSLDHSDEVDTLPLDSGINTPVIINAKSEQISLNGASSSVAFKGGKETVTISDQTINTESTSVSFEPRAESSEPPLFRPSITLSSFKPAKENLKELPDGSLELKLSPGERLVVLGEYTLSVLTGRITILGSTLSASKTATHLIQTPSSYSLPVIRCPSTELSPAVLRLQQSDVGLKSLESLSPLFGKLWNDRDSSALGAEYSQQFCKKTTSSFQIFFSSSEAPQKSFLQPLISPPDWNSHLSKLTANSPASPSKAVKPAAILICGPKGSGKSTFAKMLCNRLILSNSLTTNGVALLDLDPGQPEYSPPGFLSLHHLQTPNFGPPFTHPNLPSSKDDKRSKTIRSHFLGAISPATDSAHYLLCALDLFNAYLIFITIHPNVPLVINTPGWVLGTGLEILVDLISRINPGDVVYMSQDGPAEVVESLEEACAIVAKDKRVNFHTLPSQGSEYATRTASHLRTMLNISYFHHTDKFISKPHSIKPTSKDGAKAKKANKSKKLEEELALRWISAPLTSVPPLQVRYTGDKAGIFGIICYGEQPPANLLIDAIDGSLVSIVIIDSMAAIHGSEHLSTQTTKSSYKSSSELSDEDLGLPLQQPLIVRTPAEQIPYFNPVNIVTLNPAHSYSLGLALVRGIDAAKECLQLLTPVDPDLIQRVSVEEGKKIVLVHGTLGTPGWAYVETMAKSDSSGKSIGVPSDIAEEEVGTDVDKRTESEEAGNIGHGKLSDVELRQVPWVEKLRGSQGRGVGARVWRVRRDLGRSGDGDD